jgi:hypothetical protein
VELDADEELVDPPEDPPVDSFEPALASAAGFSLVESVESAGFAGADDARASFLAQPLPLNTIAGAERTFRSWPPHASQVVGPGE